MSIGICRHCQRERSLKLKGLCHRCYSQEDIRKQYKSESKFRSNGEPSQEEVDRTVQEQMKCLPSWFFNVSDSESEWKHREPYKQKKRRRSASG